MDKVMMAYINPLQFLEVDFPATGVAVPEMGHESVVRYLCIPGTEPDVASLVRRYREIVGDAKKLPFVPAEKSILDKLVWPLRGAIGSYVVGNYVGAMSLCGMVAEMLAILLFEMAGVHLGGNPMGEEEQKRVFGRPFERLGQERRIDILHAYKVIDDSMRDDFNKIRESRRLYLHFFSQDTEKLPRDTVETFSCIARLVSRVLIAGISEGKILLNPALLKYLEERGMFRQDI